MSQTSDKQKREHTGSIWSNFHKEKRKSHRWRKRCTDRLGLFLLLFCWITPSSEDWTRDSCSQRRARIGDGERYGNGGGRDGGDVCLREIERERDKVNGIVFYGSLLNQRWPRQTWRTEETSAGSFVSGDHSVSFTYIHITALHHLVLTISEKHFHILLQQVCPHLGAHSYQIIVLYRARQNLYLKPFRAK